MRHLLPFIAFGACGLSAATSVPGPGTDPVIAYTRAARPRALAALGDTVAVYPGSRYAYVHGYKVRLDDLHWREEAVLKDGRILVPAAFAGVLDVGPVSPTPAPAYLADRWVYSLRVPGSSAPQVDVAGQPYVDLAAEARRQGIAVWQTPRGLLVVGRPPPVLSSADPGLMDAVITLFDTPETFADPQIATRSIPTLERQGPFTDHVRATPEQLRVLSGPVTDWPTTPASAFDLRGFDATLLGSPVPPPGVYPRVLFSPQDVPGIAARVHASRMGRKALLEMGYLLSHSWWDPSTGDGQVFRKLASGKADGLAWSPLQPGADVPFNEAHLFAGEKPGIYNSHVAYVPECLTAMALYCLLTHDDLHGRQAATAIATYFRLREPLIDQWNAMSDSEFASPGLNGSGASTAWRGMHGLVAHMNLGLSLDFAGAWMTPSQKDDMRRIIAKATYGRRAYGEDAPVRFRDVNWVGWDLPQFLALASIEGLEGFDREAYETGAQTVRAFCDWGIDDSGVVFESNGKTPGSFQFITLSMVALARRGDNLFGHPHWRRLLEGQAQMTSPSGRVSVTSGTQYSPYSRQPLSLQLVDEMKAFYPSSRVADYLLTHALRNSTGAADEYARGWQITGFDPARYAGQIGTLKRLRLPSPTYPGFVPGVLYDADFEPTERRDLSLPLDFSAPTQGVFSSASDASGDAIWINMMVRPNHYLGAGHHHADAGMIHVSALGVDWLTQSPLDQTYDGTYFSLVQVDGKSEPTSVPGAVNGYNAAARYLGAVSGPGGAAAAADLTDAYCYRWMTQPPQVWTPQLSAMGWEVEPSPEILKIFAGTARYKLRPWWATYVYENYIPTCRAPFNPMRRVLRTVGLVRGSRPYAIVADDLRKDDGEHLYQWVAPLNGGVWQARVDGLAPGQIALAFRPGDPDVHSPAKHPLIVPSPGEPLLVVSSGSFQDTPTVERLEGPADRDGRRQYYDRLVVAQRGVEAHFRIILVAARAGERAPRLTGGPDHIRLAWDGGPADTLDFESPATGQTHLTVARAAEPLLKIPQAQ